MQQFIEIYGFLSVILRGSISGALSLAVGGVAFLLLIAEPLAPRLGAAAEPIAARAGRIVFWSALTLACLVSLDAAALATMLVGALELSFADALTADAVKADALAAAPALALAFAIRSGAARPLPLAAFAAALICARLGATHAISRLDNPPGLVAAELAHLTGVALWIGGIPYFLMALARAPDGEAQRAIGLRFSHLSMVAVAMIAAGGVAMSIVYIGAVENFYGAAYGVMVGAKTILFAGLLSLGALNFLAVRRSPADRGAFARLRRFAEVEIGVGWTVVFAAASLSSLPPAVDLARDRVSFAEIVERLTPQWPPRLESPDHSTLSVSLPQVQTARAEDATQTNDATAAAIAAQRNAEDIAWSEYNHHIAGLFVAAMGLLALLEHWRRLSPVARHWPMLMLGLAGFLFLRADEAVWPLGQLGLIESLRDPEIAQHRIFLALIIGFGIFEWRVRMRRVKAQWAPLAFPFITGVGGALLLAHSHGLSNIREEFLIEVTHTPLALVGLLASSARWLEIRLEGRGARIAGIVWPIAFTLAGLMLLAYREA
ncbi:putative copper resistance protein D [Methylosinus sp. sav-2]|uniref:copper resistance D family protein n=1 Tax=Methylosinus sp. sav-2 TaxID=2485168 RepID=UPI00047B0076|nr:CopD family protein [Methylosinus sp. sav-2]TDX64881.1 putative copper resistance protein D [Methylosinus sp. sav-2]